MNNENVAGVHWSFWAIAAVALIWNVMGVINFFMQMNPDALADYPEAVRSLVEGRPVRTPMGDPLIAYLAADSLSTNNIAIIKTPC